MINADIYLNNPCKAALLPYWKAKAVAVPANMLVMHEDVFSVAFLQEYSDERYFKLLHDLKTVTTPSLPMGYARSRVTSAELAAHISSCYEGSNINDEEVLRWQRRKIYREDLWVAVCDESNGQIVASGVAELDAEIGEGVLDWIQVSEKHRQRGLGKYVVTTLLRRMQGKARFVTVSGKCDDPCQPEKLYRACGFIGNDVWHVLTRRE